MIQKYYDGVHNYVTSEEDPWYILVSSAITTNSLPSSGVPRGSRAYTSDGSKEWIYGPNGWTVDSERIALVQNPAVNTVPAGRFRVSRSDFGQTFEANQGYYWDSIDFTNAPLLTAHAIIASDVGKTITGRDYQINSTSTYNTGA